jgi:hypothetical protein
MASGTVSLVTVASFSLSSMFLLFYVLYGTKLLSIITVAPLSQVPVHKYICARETCGSF